jgi:hypothetical protein
MMRAYKTTRQEYTPEQNLTWCELESQLCELIIPYLNVVGHFNISMRNDGKSMPVHRNKHRGLSFQTRSRFRTSIDASFSYSTLGLTNRTYGLKESNHVSRLATLAIQHPADSRFKYGSTTLYRVVETPDGSLQKVREQDKQITTRPATHRTILAMARLGCMISAKENLDFQNLPNMRLDEDGMAIAEPYEF